MTTAVLALWTLAILVVAVLWPARLLAMAIVLSVFEGAALFKAGGVGVSPYYLTLVLVAVRCVAIRVTPQTLLGPTKASQRAVLYGMLFATIAVAGAAVLPRVFAGLEVNSPRLSEIGTASLVFSSSNIGQAAYLVLNVALLWYTAQQRDAADIAASAIRAVMIAGTIVIGLAFYQLAAALTGLPFPEDILYSNDTFVSQSGTSILDMPRICSTFTEPSGMAVFLVALVALLTSDAGRAAGRAAWRVPLLLGAVGVLLLSTPRTAYLDLFAIGAWRLGAYLLIPLLKGRLSTRQVVLTVAGVAVVGISIAASPSLRDLIQQMVFEKDQSASYAERSDANALAWHIGYSTFGLGAGLGSNRASAFLPSLLSTTGVFGVALLGGLVVTLLRRPGAASVVAAHRGLAAALLGVVGMKLLSSPDVSTPSMWALLAALGATHAAPAAVAGPIAAEQQTAPAFVPPRRRFIESNPMRPTGPGVTA
ncbi:MAG: putative rane protein [Phycisphaerales bacterium]|nr:putative rane protein [Phycisphaerales bacterium]